MKTTFKIWELALLCALVITVLWSALISAQQAELSDRLIRLHVLAHSDTAAAQDAKYLVRDRILDEITPLLQGSADRQTAAHVLTDNLAKITETAAAVLAEQGLDYPVSVRLTHESSPARVYDTFALPAGSYHALRVEIGAADGANWWCVVFPPLCLEAAEITIDAMETANFTEDEIALLTEDSPGIAIRFRSLEMIESLRGWFQRG